MRSLVLLSLVVTAACSSGPRLAATTSEETVRVVGGSGGTVQMATTTSTRPRTVTVDVPLDKAWNALPAAYESVGIELARHDRTARLAGNPGFRARRTLGGTRISRYLDCGRAQGNPSADTYEVHFSVMTQLAGDSARTIVTTTVDATARPVNFAGESVRCVSTGELEIRLVNGLSLQAK